ncbi:MAG: hypothetical protein IJ643_04220 [Eubacterium sp.]|nr:hypothetical protein [Eubacterium sp.]
MQKPIISIAFSTARVQCSSPELTPETNLAKLPYSASAMPMPIHPKREQVKIQLRKLPM